MRLLIDEDAQAKWLVNLLRQAEHDVETVSEAGLSGREDAAVLDYTRQTYRLLLTYNCDDFKILHDQQVSHAGILAIYDESDSSKNLTYSEIVRAIEARQGYAHQIGWSLSGEFIALNHKRRK